MTAEGVLAAILWALTAVAFVGASWFTGYAAEWGAGSDPSLEGLLWGVGVVLWLLWVGLALLAVWATGKAVDA